ncbi:hypothetical protein [Clostridium ganghwense]|uniref:Lipoprotein n=1 Tax=Clostridium ganghwense TaxID=312089 RepID=A0ABT4CQK7_9CLOT|nr:hypothetical protein [Clostridium ganghwense]MCY6371340.1 hypothetical protein [Clostridium ganghwense]
MKKKILCLILSVISVTGLFVGCSGANKTASNSNTTAISGAEKKGENSKTENKNRNQAYIMGKVKNIVGNEITIDLVDMPERPQRSEGETKKKGEETKGMGSGGSRERVADNIKLTGESEVVIIPVGTPIVSNKRGDDGMEKTELQLEDIYEGMILQIWLKAGSEGKDKTAEKVVVSAMK